MLRRGMNARTGVTPLALCLALSALALGGRPAAGATAGPSLGTLPATFTGILPCADCAGIRYQIEVLPRSAFSQKLDDLLRQCASRV